MTRSLRGSGRISLLFLLLLGSLTLSATMAIAQPITVRAVAAPVNTLSINDFDFLNSTTPKWLFTVDISTGRSTPVSVALQIEANVTLSDGEQFPRAVVMLTRAFTVIGARTVTNLDFSRGGSIRDSSYVVDSDAKHRFQDIALPTGTMPTGSYSFNVIPIEVATGATGGGDHVQYHLTNPTTVDLLFPFDGDQNVTQLPLFQWKFDGTRSKIYVYEKLPGQGSLEEAASGVPMLSTEVPTSSLQYPTSGVRALQQGKTYVWYVEGRYTASGGNDILLKSTLRSFTVATTSASGGAASSILDELERALDPKYKPVFDQIRAEGFSSSGSIRLNGSPVSTSDLLRIFNQLRTHADGILQVTLE